MTRYGVFAGLAMVLAMGNVGCYLDKLQAEQRANRVLQEDLARTKADLQDAEALNKQKDTQIDALGKQLATKDEQVNSLTAENSTLRDALKKAQDILEAQAGKGAGTIAIMRSALPPALNEALKKLAEEYPNLLEFDPKTGVVRWKADLLFPLGSDAPVGFDAILEALKKFAEIVNSRQGQRLRRDHRRPHLQHADQEGGHAAGAQDQLAPVRPPRDRDHEHAGRRAGGP